MRLTYDSSKGPDAAAYGSLKEPDAADPYGFL